MSVWGILVEKALRVGDRAAYEYMKNQGTLAAHIQRRESEMAAIYEARIRAGDDGATAVNRTILEYAETMKNEEMTESDAERVVTKWLASRGDDGQPLGSSLEGKYPTIEPGGLVDGNEARRLGMPILDEKTDPKDAKRNVERGAK